MDKLSDLIKCRMERHSLSDSARSAEILYKANILLAEIFGKQKLCAKAYRFSKGVLFVSTENSVWSQEIWGAREGLLDGMRKEFGAKAVLKIVIKNLTIE